MAIRRNSADEQEIDMADISRNVRNAVSGFGDSIFRFMQFMVRKKFILLILIIIGATLGYFMDKNKSYDHTIIVAPNFGSADYLYNKVNLINSKIRARDTAFLKQIGVRQPEFLNEITIQPIVDVYRFVGLNDYNYKLLELLAKDGDLKKIVTENITSKNYPNHMISYSTRGMTSDAETKAPILNYLNNSSFFAKIQQEYIKNVLEKMRANENTIAQIDGVLNNFSETAAGGKTANLVYYNENTQLNDVIKTKDELIKEQGNHRLDLVSLNKIVKELSSTLNVENKSGLNGKMKFVVPLVLIGIYMILYVIVSFYRNRSVSNRIA